MRSLPLLLASSPLGLSFSPFAAHRALWSAPPIRAASLDFTEVAVSEEPFSNDVSAEEPLRVVIAGAGVGGLVLANAFAGNDKVQVHRSLLRTPTRPLACSLNHSPVMCSEESPSCILHSTRSRFSRRRQSSNGSAVPFSSVGRNAPHLCVAASRGSVTFPIFSRAAASNAMQVLKDMDAVMFSDIIGKATFTGNLTNGIKDGMPAPVVAPSTLHPCKSRCSVSSAGILISPALSMLGWHPRAVEPQQ